MAMTDDLLELVRTSVHQALVRSPDEIGAALAEFGWADLVQEDEALAFTTLFEAQGHLAVDTVALDVAALSLLADDLDGAIVWPLGPGRLDEPVGGQLRFEGVALRGAADRPLLVPAGGALHVVNLASFEESPLGGMGADAPWTRVRAEGESVAADGSWSEIRRRAQLALASELVGVGQRMLDLAVEQVSSRRQFGRPIGAYQAVRHRLAEAYSELAGARALVAAAWDDGTPAAAERSKAVAGLAQDAVAKHVQQVCGAIGFHEEHELPGLVRRGFRLDALLGAARAEPERLGAAMLDGVVPEPVSTF